MSQTTTPVIELRDVRVVYSSRTGTLFKPVKVKAVDGVSLRIMPGRTLGIVGESGSGKTTTARILLGLEQPTSGEVWFKGNLTGKRNARQRKDIGRVVSAVFQDPATALNPRMVIRDALRDAAPMLIGVVPFGLVAGAAPIAAGMSALDAVSMSVIIFGGSSQLAMTEVFREVFADFDPQVVAAYFGTL